MKLRRKIIAGILIIATLCATVFTGCGSDKYDDPNTLYISVWDSGYGLNWLNGIVAQYQKNNPDVTVKVESTTLRDKATLPLSSKTYYDIIICDNSAIAYESRYSRIAGYDRNFVEITDVFNSTAEGEDGVIKDKLTDLTKWFCDVDGKNFYMPLMSSVWGLSYNRDILKNYYIPKTSYEMQNLCETLKSDTSIKYPIIFSGDTDYWDPILWTWWAQYDGKDSYNAFYKGQDLNGKYTVDIFSSTGRLRALETVETFLTPSNNYCDPNSTGLGFMTAQLGYLKGEYAFMANGGWVENEMAASFKGRQIADFDFMEIPIISSIVEKLSFYNDGSKAWKDLSAEKKSEYDAVLSSIVAYVDGDSTVKPEGVTDADIKTVKDARDLFYMTDLYFCAMLPCYCAKVDMAKSFMKYLYSDEAAKIYMNSGVGALLPIKYDFVSEQEYNALPPRRKTLMKYLNEKDLIITSYMDPIVYQGGLTDFAITGTLETNFGSVNPADRKTANDIFMYDYNYYRSGNAWSNLLSAAGISQG